MKYRNAVLKYGRKASTGIAAGAAVIGCTMMQAYAALPTEATGSITAAKDDTSELGYLVLGVLVLVAGFKWMRRAL